MRVITSVYLHCRPELRDEWLSGGEVERGVEESVGLEMGIRGLTFWGLGRRYRDKMGGRGEEEEEGEPDGGFFRRELEKMEWAGVGEEEESEVGWEAGW